MELSLDRKENYSLLFDYAFVYLFKVKRLIFLSFLESS